MLLTSSDAQGILLSEIHFRSLTLFLGLVYFAKLSKKCLFALFISYFICWTCSQVVHIGVIYCTVARMDNVSLNLFLTQIEETKYHVNTLNVYCKYISALHSSNRMNYSPVCSHGHRLRCPLVFKGSFWQLLCSHFGFSRLSWIISPSRSLDFAFPFF